MVREHTCKKLSQISKFSITNSHNKQLKPRYKSKKPLKFQVFHKTDTAKSIYITKMHKKTEYIYQTCM